MLFVDKVLIALICGIAVPLLLVPLNALYLLRLLRSDVAPHAEVCGADP